ncbi:MAG TPA: hypothetical protein DIW81_16600 [Planctomycetaceae bacterium]|nr:hypothetical protein [Planctomycetaceae bacterium]
MLLPLGMKQLGLSMPQLFKQGVLTQWIPLSLILVYSYFVHSLNIEPEWTQILGVFAGAIVVLIGGIGLSERIRSQAHAQSTHLSQNIISTGN